MSFKVDIISAENVHIKTLEVSENKSLLSSFIQSKFNIDHTCGGNATCGTCRIFILKGSLNARTKLENEWTQDRNFRESERLSCQAIPKSDLVIQIPK